jgi:hypothetical protein
VAPWWWFPCKPKHVGAFSIILIYFNNSMFSRCVRWLDNKVFWYHWCTVHLWRWASLLRAWTVMYNVFVFRAQFFIILNVAVGGNFFPDGLYNSPHPKPWSRNSSHPMQDFWERRNWWLPTWDEEDRAMRVDYIRVYCYDCNWTVCTCFQCCQCVPIYSICGSFPGSRYRNQDHYSQNYMQKRMDTDDLF